MNHNPVVLTLNSKKGYSYELFLGFAALKRLLNAFQHSPLNKALFKPSYFLVYLLVHSAKLQDHLRQAQSQSSRLGRIVNVSYAR